MNTFITDGILISLGFILGSFWVKSGEETPITKEKYKQIVAASTVWLAVLYEYMKKYLTITDE